MLDHGQYAVGERTRVVKTQQSKGSTLLQPSTSEHLSDVSRPADVDGEDVLGQQLGSHGGVKHRGDFGHRNGGVRHAQHAVEAGHGKSDSRLLHCLSKLKSEERGIESRKRTVTVSWLMKPDRLPLPYWIENSVPFFTYVLDFFEL
ncbi:unnamed protein product [Menidia menidia]|uniref:(Atlantic silverside) hypothetical protein n=1 Tax=Menidia menidia TaxID=238744 RepID=A0A8S4B0D8_9TELE|nr:unnamed protein product [Menidia menidia]